MRNNKCNAAGIRTLLLLLSCVALFPRRAMCVDNCGTLDRVVIAIRLAEVVYPALKGAEFSVQFSEGTGGSLSGPADVRNLLITLDKPEWHAPARETSDKPALSSRLTQNAITLPLYLHFGFIDYESVERKLGKDLVCRPVEFMNRIESGLLNDARTTINAHPEWAETQAVASAKQHGMRFGPNEKEAILQHIPIGDLAAFYGAIRIEKARFDLYSGAKCEGCSFADLRWYIDAEEVDRQRELQITLDPFEGKIDSISESKRD